MQAAKKKSEGPGGGKAPFVLESEQALIGCCLRLPDVAATVVSELQETDFYASKTNRAYVCLKNLLEENLTPTHHTVADRSGLSLAEVAELAAASDGIGQEQIRTLVSEVRRTGTLRSVHAACVNASLQIQNGGTSEEVLTDLESAIYAASSDGSASEPEDGARVMAGVVESFIRRSGEGGGPEVSTGLKDLDRAIIGLRPGKMGVIAARPSMGKTALARTIGRSVLAQGLGVIEFALEMSKEEILERELAYQSGVGLTKVLSAKNVTQDELSRVQAAGQCVHGDLWFIDDNTYTIAGMRRKARIISSKLHRHGSRPGIVIVDYLQLAGDHGEGREQAIAAVSKGCKLMAKELGCTVLALSQLNRMCEYREDKRPMMSDLRESGSIEQDADWVGFVYREHMYDNSFPAEESEFIIRKQRSGPTGTIHLHYNPKTVTFSDRVLKSAELDLSDIPE